MSIQVTEEHKKHLEHLQQMKAMAEQTNAEVNTEAAQSVIDYNVMLGNLSDPAETEVE